jgi:hypothetical protein
MTTNLMTMKRRTMTKTKRRKSMVRKRRRFAERRRVADRAAVPRSAMRARSGVCHQCERPRPMPDRQWSEAEI